MRILSKIFSSILVFSLLSFGALFALSFIPLQAQAGLLSSIFGDEIYAQTDAVDGSKDLKQSLQTMALLQANVSSASLFQDKSDKKDDQIDASVDVTIVDDKVLRSVSGSMGVSDGKDILNFCSDQPSVYPVAENDSISKIAKMFGVSVNTILAANDLKKSDKLTVGQVLFIPPISSIEHTVASGQTLQSIAKLYKVDVNDIALCNGIAQNAKLIIGIALMIPGVDSMADEGGDKPAPNLDTALARDKNYYNTHPTPDCKDCFIYPLPPGVARKTQGLHGPGNRGIDYGAPTGTELYASAPGTVLIVKTGCKVGKKTCGGGYGNMAIIQLSSGVKILYAHMSKVLVQTGDRVAQKDVIGLVGSTGRSTGPHLHIEFFYTKNPGANNSWAN